jgi:hypothetical protein
LKTVLAGAEDAGAQSQSSDFLSFGSTPSEMEATMERKWTRPRQELIDIGANLCYRGWSVPGIAEGMVERHFQGIGRRQAARRLGHDIAAAFWRSYGGLTEKQQQVSVMAELLRKDGWAPLFDEYGQGCFWRHESGVTVNSQGGFFPCFERATKAAYESQTRAMLLRTATN